MKELIKLLLTLLRIVIILFIGFLFVMGIRDAFFVIAPTLILALLAVLLAYLGTWLYEFLDEHL